MGKYRSRLQIVADMLSVASCDDVKKTKLVNFSNLSWKLFNRYLNHLMDAGLISLSSDRYALTPKGELFLQRLKEYFKRRKRVEERLNDLEDERRLLENVCFNREGLIESGSQADLS